MTEERIFGSDPMDRFSKVLRFEPGPCGIGTKIVSPIRALPEKPGRSLFVLQDARVSDIPGFSPAFEYVNIFWKGGNRAGDHYHLVKHEIFTVLKGSVWVYLRVKDSRAIAVLELSAPRKHSLEVCRLYIPAGVVHAVVAKVNHTILHVSATSPNSNSDEYSEKI